MPTACAHYRHLVDRVAELESKFVADQAAAEAADPTGFSVDLDRLAAFRLLVHAELEWFLESKATEHINLLDASLSAATPWMRTAPALLPLAVVTSKTPPVGLDAAGFSAFVAELIAAARAVVRENNGVKEKAFWALSVCAGKTVDEIDNALSASLNSYGKDRGEVAHRSVTHTRCIQAPSAELLSARDLVRQLGLYFDVCP